MSNIAENRSAGKAEQDVRAELRWLCARYDGAGIPLAIFTVIRSLESELAWLEHGNLSRTGGSR
jgi:hypothetical protein